MGVDVPDDRIATRSGGRGLRPGGWLDRLRMGLRQGRARARARAGTGGGGVGPGLRTAARGEGDGGGHGERRDQQPERRGDQRPERRLAAPGQLHTGQWPLVQEQTGSSAPAR